MGPYTNIKSNYIKQKIKETSWENRKYIRMLKLIEKYITVGVVGAGSGYMIHDFKNKHPEDYEAIWKELKPEEYERIKQAEKESKEKERKLEIERQEELKQLEKEEREDWIAAGGKI